MTTSVSTKKLSIKFQTLGAVICIIAAVSIPQILHLLGAATGVGTSLGEIFLPMHLPIILAGLLAGPYAAGAAGFLSPLISFMLTGMPKQQNLLFMMIELTVYGICAGILRDVKLNSVLKVLITQGAGRIVRISAMAAGLYLFDLQVSPLSVLYGIKTGLIGIILQLILIPLICVRIKNADK